MEKYTQQQSKANYDRLSRWYDLIAGSSEQRFRKIGLEMLSPQPGEKIMELGCGTGQSILTINEATGKNGLAIGLDLSSGMLKVAKARYSQVKRAPILINGSANALPVKPQSLDAVFICFTLELFHEEQMKAVLSETKRSLLTEGRLVIVSMALPQKFSLISKSYAWAHEHYPNLCDCRPIDARSITEKTGFSCTQSLRKSMWGLPVDILAFDKM